eukprot:8994911-Karenia_brevis.AAC.1
MYRIPTPASPPDHDYMQQRSGVWESSYSSTTPKGDESDMNVDQTNEVTSYGAAYTITNTLTYVSWRPTT